MNKRLLLALGLGTIVLAVVLFFVLGGKGTKKKGDPGHDPDVARTGEHGSGTAAGSGDTGGGGGGPDQPILVDDDPAGEQRLEGQVIDADDQPVGGATVVISSNPERTTTTEEDGSFVFEKLVGRPYQVAARAPAGVAGPLTVRLTARTEPVILKLRPASSVVIEVVDDAGASVDGATVELRGLDTQVATTAAGKATITPVIPGGYQIAAWAPGFAHAYAWVNIAQENETERIALHRGSAVAGRVLTEDGTPVAGARVLYHGASDWSQQPDERRDGQVTDTDGHFAFDAIGVGSWRFAATHPDHAPGTSPIVTVDGNRALDDVVITMPAGATVSGVVVDAQKHPVASARVRIGVQKASFAAGPPRQVFSGADGTFTVRGLPKRALEAVAVSEEGASATTPIDASNGDVGGVEIVVDVTGTIAGIVVDESGEPLEGVQVSAVPDFRKAATGGGGGGMSSWRLRGFPQDLTDASGHFKLVGLEKGGRMRAGRTEQRGRRGRGGFAGSDGVSAKTGDTNVKIVVPEDGGVKGKVAFEDGTAPAAFTVSIDFDGQPFSTKDGSFEVDDLPPREYQIEIRGNDFEPKIVKGTVESGKVADLGAITVHKGRTIRGVVTSNGAPVAGATVYAGVQIFGNGTSNEAGMGGPPGAGNTRKATTADDGSFSITGFGRRDVTVIAEHEQLGRSRAIRVVKGDPSEQSLVIALEPFGTLTGKVTDGGQTQEGQIVSVQSVTAPGAMYGVSSGADGTFRLDRLAPDRYKVSAMTGMNPMRGMGFFSKTVEVLGGKESHVEVAIERGTITLDVTPTADRPVGGYGWIASGQVMAHNGGDLNVMLAQQGEGMSNFSIFPKGTHAFFRELTAGDYTVCLLPVPAEVEGMAAFQYAMNHGDELPAFCQGVKITATPDAQQMSMTVQIPTLLPDE